ITPEAMAAREFDLAFSLGPGDPGPSELALRELERDEPDVRAVRSEQAARVRDELLMMSDRAGAGVRDGLREVFDRLLAMQLDDRSEPMLRRLERIEREQPRQTAACEALRGDFALFIDATALVRQIEAVERAFSFAYLARRCKALLFGDCDAGAWLKAAAAGTRVESFAPDQGATYRRARVGLSVMRWQDDVGVHLKPLEIAAAGAVPLVARRTGIEAMFESTTECEVFDTLADGLAALRAITGDPARAAAMANAARARVVRDHTWKQRAEAMLAEVERGVGGWVVR
ncbi:MAG: glycosyltransferase, partial [Phycisphaerales bacterium]|nr:glycosyltransferase [Phycisphaerales bacterium]